MNEYSTKSKKIALSPFILYTIVTFLVYVLPYTKVVVPYIIAGTLMLIFLPVAMLKRKKWMNYVVVLIVLSILILFLDLLSGKYSIVESINEMIRNIRFFLPILWATYAMECCSVKSYKGFFWCFYIVIGIMLFKTLVALAQDPWIARVLAKGNYSDTAELRSYRLQNIGGFEFSYMMGIVTFCFAWTAIKVDSKRSKVMYICAAIISFYYIIQTMYTTLLLLTSIGILLLLIFNIKNPIIKLTISILFCVLAFGMAPFLEYLSGIFEDSLLSTKFMQMHAALTGGGVDALGKRPQYILEAINNWLHSPLIGGYDIGYYTHSMIFTTLEKNGIVGLFSLGYMLYSSWELLRQHMKKFKADTLLLNIAFLYVISLAILNSIGYVFEVTITAFFFVPIWTVFIVNKGRTKDEKKDI